MATKFIVVAGGVISGVGKGVITASIGKILQEHGYNTTLMKIDPYVNVDAGTLRPTEHGEVWVTEDGGEIDQDLGTYERFMHTDIPKQNNITTGQIYQTVIERERRGEYLGKTVQFVPHITDEIIARIKKATKNYEFAIIEIGGTAGDYENIPFLFAFKALEREIGSDQCAYVLVSYLPVPSHIDEMKTKPTQQAIRLLGEQGIIPDFIVCRSPYPLDTIRRKKIEVYANLSSDYIIDAPDLPSVVYQMPIELEKQDLGKKILSHFNLTSKQLPNWNPWIEKIQHITEAGKRVHIAIVGKYIANGLHSMTDSYISICHALIHAGAELFVGVDIDWLDSNEFENNPSVLSKLSNYDGIIIPGGFGSSGVEGKIAAIEYVRTHAIPFLGICYGMQLAAIEYARHVCNLNGAHTTEINSKTKYPIVDLLPLQQALLNQQQYGGTMRLGAYTATIKPYSKIESLYQNMGYKGSPLQVSERHRHRYEINPAFVEQLEKNGLTFSGSFTRSDNTTLMEYLELPTHPFFIGTQAHPEFKSQFGHPNPLFYGFIQAAIAQEATLLKETQKNKKDINLETQLA